MRAKEFIVEADPYKTIRDFDRTRVAVGKSSMFGDQTAEKVKWMGSARYNTSGRTWRHSDTPTFFFNARSEYEAKRYVRGRLPKSARNVEITVKEVPDRSHEVDEQSPAANAAALVGSGRGPTGTHPKGKGDSPEHRKVRTPGTTYSKSPNQKKYGKPGAEDGFVGG